MGTNREMDPSGLSGSELAIEFLVRKLDARREDALRELAELMSLEDTGKRVRPANMHATFTAPEAEIPICERKIQKLEVEVENAYTSRDQNQVYVLSNRIEHVKGRLVRLVKNFPGNDIACGKLSAVCDKLLSRLGAAMVPLGQETQQIDSESRRSTFPSESALNASGLPINLGAIPNTGNTSRSKAKKITGRRQPVEERTLPKQTLSTVSLFNSQQSPTLQTKYDFPPRPSLNAAASPFISRISNANFFPSNDFINMYDEVCWVVNPELLIYS